ncbi:hypothetical protein A8E62_32510 [Burkholderia cenocepacia]|uniref:Uncharacterized protein n=1 Tax=Burkholderia cenocepacia TaxID=95486 RepID=A0A1V2W665_9BURK|nr:hypothetical protein A8E66_36155 [Burkholderia cenocepacia]ONU47542.1 hypothetical protein A8E62_32510 [Burkholderia cenocepacia]ONU52384.1 hypothetical protein A8E67_32345 [Burkholderia cenocepacia]ONU58621.1 hypothetical protein A8E68_23715 [Burkholderia cenocepacia]ONU63583.1 hypothetical protein A8E68_13530 [Burkholderia cenocepacia]
MQLPKTAKNRNLETVRIRVLPPVLLAPLRRPSPAPLRRPATQAYESVGMFENTFETTCTESTGDAPHVSAKATSISTTAGGSPC